MMLPPEDSDALELVPAQDDGGLQQDYCLLGDGCLFRTGVVGQSERQEDPKLPKLSKCVLCKLRVHEECQQLVSHEACVACRGSGGRETSVRTYLQDILTSVSTVENSHVPVGCAAILEQVCKYDACEFICTWCTSILEPPEEGE